MNKKVLSIVFNLISVVFCTLAVLRFTSSDTSAGIWLLCIGAVFLCFGSATLAKAKVNEEKPKADEETEEKPDDKE